MVAILQTLILILGCSQVALTCHYSCATCSSDHYYECTLCSPGRGNNLLPIDGMCYCSNSYDEDDDGICESSGSYNISVKVAIWVFIGLSLLLSLATTLIKGMRYFLYKTIDDVQELSLIVFLNLYFPQQFDLFLSGLYRFNISSFTFQNLAIGSLFIV